MPRATSCSGGRISPGQEPRIDVEITYTQAPTAMCDSPRRGGRASREEGVMPRSVIRCIVIEGPRLLDLGAGEGYVAAALARRGQRAVCADVGPFRRVPIPYVVYDGRRLPFRDATFDTTFVRLTLHHCAAPEATLDEAIRVTRG